MAAKKTVKKEVKVSPALVAKRRVMLTKMVLDIFDKKVDGIVVVGEITKKGLTYTQVTNGMSHGTMHLVLSRLEESVHPEVSEIREGVDALMNKILSSGIKKSSKKSKK